VTSNARSSGTESSNSDGGGGGGCERGGFMCKLDDIAGVGSPERELEWFERRLSGMTFGTRRDVGPTGDAVGENRVLAFVAEASDAVGTCAAVS
jgi:hypothetical protein